MVNTLCPLLIVYILLIFDHFLTLIYFVERSVMNQMEYNMFYDCIVYKTVDIVFLVLGDQNENY